jgi:hypothetical protein
MSPRGCQPLLGLAHLIGELLKEVLSNNEPIANHTRSHVRVRNQLNWSSLAMRKQFDHLPKLFQS